MGLYLYKVVAELWVDAGSWDVEVGPGRLGAVRASGLGQSVLSLFCKRYEFSFLAAALTLYFCTATL